MAQLLTVSITGVAWFFISNHCVLAEFQHASKAKTSCHQPCCGDQPSTKSQKESGLECCKTLRATLAGAKGFAGYDSSLFALQHYFVRPLICIDDLGARSPVVELDTGPPFANTFAESVLQRSILAHAPPFIA
jgi:hypothetical protein